MFIARTGQEEPTPLGVECLACDWMAPAAYMSPRWGEGSLASAFYKHGPLEGYHQRSWWMQPRSGCRSWWIVHIQPDADQPESDSDPTVRLCCLYLLFRFL
jgi:hypothetical protein